MRHMPTTAHDRFAVGETIHVFVLMPVRRIQRWSHFGDLLVNPCEVGDLTALWTPGDVREDSGPLPGQRVLLGSEV